MGQTRGLSRESFMQDETLKRAFVRSLEIVGEATKQMPAALKRKYPQVDWRGMAGMRDRLIHAYFAVNYKIVWDVATTEVPGLVEQVESIVRAERGA